MKTTEAIRIANPSEALVAFIEPKQQKERMEQMPEPYTVEELREGIARSERQYARGEFYTQAEAHEMMEQFVQQRV